MIALVVLAALAAGGMVERLNLEEGEALRALVSVARGASKVEALVRLSEWEREQAAGLRASDAPLHDIDDHLARGEASLEEALALDAGDRRAELLFALGDLRRARGRPDDAAKALTSLLAHHADDARAPDAATALGDDAFEVGRLADAVSAYKFAEAHAREPSALAYARYKRAWCHLNLEEYAEARRLFDAVLEGPAVEGAVPLAREAARDYVIACARDAGVAASEGRRLIELRSTAPVRFSYVTSYARLIAGAGRDAEAAGLLGRIIEGAPTEGLASALALAVDVATRRRDLALLGLAGDRLGDLVEATGAKSEEGERTLRVAAVTMHGEGRAAGDAVRISMADRLYRAWFRAFDGGEGGYELHHHFGELLRSQGRCAEAERHYTAAVEHDLELLSTHGQGGRWLADSVHGALECGQRALQVDVAAPVVESAEEDVVAPVPSPTPLEADERVFLAACERAQRAVPGSPDADRARLNAALLQLRHHLFENVVESLSTLIADGGAFAAPASRVMLEALRGAHRYDDVAHWADRWSALGWARPMRAELVSVRAGALMAAAARSMALGETRDAVARYLSVAGKGDASVFRAQALFNAAAGLASMGMVSDAVRVRSRLLADASKGTLLGQARERQVDELTLLGRFGEAAPLALQLAEDSKGETSAGWRHEAIVLAEADGQRARADGWRRRFVELHRTSPRALEHAVALAEHAVTCVERLGAWRLAALLPSEAEPRARAQLRLAETAMSCHRVDEAEGMARRLLTSGTGREPSMLPADILAEAMLLMTVPVAARYEQQTLGDPWERTLPRKLELLETLEQRLSGVVQSGRARAAVCALTTSGRAFASLSFALSEARAPRGFDEAQRDLFAQALSEKAQPLVERARASLESAVTKAREAGIEPSCLAEVPTLLARLDPQRYGARLERTASLMDEDEVSNAADLIARAPDAPMSWILAARELLAAHKPQAALVLLSRFGAEDVHFAEALELRARALEQTGQGDEARMLWSQLMERFPERRLAPRVLATRALVMRDDEGARLLLERLHAVDASDDAVTVDLAIARRAVGDAEGAVQLLQPLARRDSPMAEAQLALGLFWCAEGARPPDGVSLLETVSSTHPAWLEGPAAGALPACRALASARGGG